jgi:hypothetical protein
MADETPTPKVPAKKVLERQRIGMAKIEKDKKLSEAVTDWAARGAELAACIKASGVAKETLKAMLGPRLKIKPGVDWDIKMDGQDALIVEIIEKKPSERSRIPTKDVDF